MRKFKLKNFAIILSMAAATCTFATINNTYAMDNNINKEELLGLKLNSGSESEDLEQYIRTSDDDKKADEKAKSEIATAVNTEKADEETDNKSEQTSKTEEKKEEPKQNIITSNTYEIADAPEKLYNEIRPKREAANKKHPDKSESEFEPKFESEFESELKKRPYDKPKSKIATAVNTKKSDEEKDNKNKVTSKIEEKKEEPKQNIITSNTHEIADTPEKLYNEIRSKREAANKKHPDKSESEFEPKFKSELKKHPYDKPKSKIATAVNTKKSDEKIDNKNKVTSKIEEKKEEPKQNIITSNTHEIADTPEKLYNKIKSKMKTSKEAAIKEHPDKSESEFEPKTKPITSHASKETKSGSVKFEEKLPDGYHLEHVGCDDQYTCTIYDTDGKPVKTCSSKKEAMLVYEMLINQKNNCKREKEIENLKNKKRYNLCNGFYYYSFNDKNGKETHALFKSLICQRQVRELYLGEYRNYNDLMKDYKYLNEENLKEIKKEEKQEIETFIFDDGFYYIKIIGENRIKNYILVDPDGNILGNYPKITELIKARSEFKKIQKNKKSNKEIQNKPETQDESQTKTEITIKKFSDGGYCTYIENENKKITYYFYGPNKKYLGNYSDPIKKYLNNVEIDYKYSDLLQENKKKSDNKLDENKTIIYEFYDLMKNI